MVNPGRSWQIQNGLFNITLTNQYSFTTTIKLYTHIRTTSLKWKRIVKIKVLIPNQKRLSEIDLLIRNNSVLLKWKFFAYYKKPIPA